MVLKDLSSDLTVRGFFKSTVHLFGSHVVVLFSDLITEMTDFGFLFFKSVPPEWGF